MHNYGLHGFGMGFGFWLIILLVLFFIFYQLKEKNNKKRSSAKEILDKRYAKGELDTDEYHERLNEILSTQRSDDDLFSKDK